jgi:chitinase
MQYADAGISLIVSAFGATDIPTAADPVALAGQLATFVRDNMLDGVDVDYEDLDGMNAKNGRSEQWLIDFTRALRAQLPSPDFILTHAPLAPW